MERFKKKVYDWSGFKMKAETKEELKSELESIYETLTNGISDRYQRYDLEIDNLNIPE